MRRCFPTRDHALSLRFQKIDVVEPTVTQEFMPGYKLHERVIRTAKVKVTMPAPENAAAPSGTPKGEASADEDGEPQQQG